LVIVEDCLLLGFELIGLAGIRRKMKSNIKDEKRQGQLALPFLVFSSTLFEPNLTNNKKEILINGFQLTGLSLMG